MSYGYECYVSYEYEQLVVVVRRNKHKHYISVGGLPVRPPVD